MFIGPSGFLHDGGCQDDCNLTYARRYPVILQGKYQITQLMIYHERL